MSDEPTAVETPPTGVEKPKRDHRRKKPRPGFVRIPHPLLIWMPDGGTGMMGLRSHTVFFRVAFTGTSFKVVPTFPLPRGSRVSNAEYPDAERAMRIAEMFFADWLRIVGLETTDIEVPAVR